jgi:hypothetical protein
MNEYLKIRKFIALFVILLFLPGPSIHLFAYQASGEETARSRLEYYKQQTKKWLQDLNTYNEAVLNDTLLINRTITDLKQYIAEIDTYLKEESSARLEDPPNENGEFTLKFQKFESKINNLFPEKNDNKNINVITDSTESSFEENAMAGNVEHGTALWVILLFIILIFSVFTIGYFVFKLLSSNTINELSDEVANIGFRLRKMEDHITNPEQFVNQHKQIARVLNEQTVKVNENSDKINTLKAEINVLKNAANSRKEPITFTQNVAGPKAQQIITRSLSDEYNQAQLNRLDRKMFSEKMITCTLQNRNSIIINKADEKPEFARGDGYFMITDDGKTVSEMVVAFGIPLTDTAIIETAFNVSKVPGMEFDLKIKKTAKVFKRGTFWVLHQKGELDIRA